MRLIDADMLSPDRDYYDNSICSGYDAVSCQQIDSATTVKAISIPEGTTNGDMIKAMFPKIEIYTDVINEIVDVEICEDSSELRCSIDWWNAPYKEVDEWI